MPRRNRNRKTAAAITAATGPASPHLRAAVLSWPAGSRMVARTERNVVEHSAYKSCNVRRRHFRNGGDAAGRKLSRDASPLAGFTPAPRAHLGPSRHWPSAAAARAADAAARQL